MAARAALQELFGIDADNYVEETRNEIFRDEEPRKEVPVELSNRIAEAVQQRFLEVFQGETQCKVIAAFVVADHGDSDSSSSRRQGDANEELHFKEEEMDEDEKEESTPMLPRCLRVVSIGTGTKCITGEMMEHKGETLNDCHGEIIACRGFRRYLFDELLKAMKNNNANTSNDDTIFQRALKSNRYCLKDRYQVYLFVNTAPCGDGRVFTLQTQQQQGAKNKTAGLLRTKIENGQGMVIRGVCFVIDLST